MKILYVDASFDWTSTNESDGTIVRGKIAVSDGKDFNRIDKVAVGKVKGLQQYINIFELTAIARAIELAQENDSGGDRSLAIYSDSQVAVIWASSGFIKSKVCTEAHTNALEYLRKARILYGGLITFNQISRENNPAGFLLEDELEKERPHTP